MYLSQPRLDVPVPTDSRRLSTPAHGGSTAMAQRRRGIRLPDAGGLQAGGKSFAASNAVLEQSIAMRRKLLSDSGGAAQAEFSRECRIGLRSAIPDMVDYLCNSIDFEDEADIKREISRGLEEMVDKTIRAGWSKVGEDLERLHHLERKTASLEKHLTESQKAYLLEVVEMRQQLRRNSLLVDEEAVVVYPEDIAKIWFDPLNHGLDFPEIRPGRSGSDELQQVREETTQSLKELVRLTVEERLRIILSDPSMIVRKLREMGNLSALITILTADDDGFGYGDDTWRLGLRTPKGEGCSEALCEAVQTEVVEEDEKREQEEERYQRPRRGSEDSQLESSPLVRQDEVESTSPSPAGLTIRRELQRVELKLEEAQKEASVQKKAAEDSKAELEVLGARFGAAKARIHELEKGLVVEGKGRAPVSAASPVAVEGVRPKAKTSSEAAEAAQPRRASKADRSEGRPSIEKLALKEEVERLRYRLKITEDLNAVMESEILNRSVEKPSSVDQSQVHGPDGFLPYLKKRSRRASAPVQHTKRDSCTPELDWQKVWLRLYLDAFRRIKDLDSLRVKQLLMNKDKFLEMMRSRREDAFDGHFDFPGEPDDDSAFLSSSFAPFRSTLSDLWTIDSWFESRQSTRADKSRKRLMEPPNGSSRCYGLPPRAVSAAPQGVNIATWNLMSTAHILRSHKEAARQLDSVAVVLGRKLREASRRNNDLAMLSRKHASRVRVLPQAQPIVKDVKSCTRTLPKVSCDTRELERIYGKGTSNRAWKVEQRREVRQRLKTPVPGRCDLEAGLVDLQRRYHRIVGSNGPHGTQHVTTDVAASSHVFLRCPDALRALCWGGCWAMTVLVSFCLLHPECKGRILPSASGKSVLIDNAAIGGDVIFDSVMKGGKPQDELFEIICKPYLRTLLVDKRGSSSGLLVLAAGPSGAGKTFCVTGGATKFSDRGLIPRTLTHLFDHKANSMRVEISFYEIYKEEVIDLLSPEAKISHSDDLTRMQVENESGAYQALFTGDSNRHFEKMTQNAEASRGHAVFEVLINGQDKITFVDLAVHVPNCRTSTSRLNKKSQDALRNVIHSMAQQEKWRSSHGRDSSHSQSPAFRQSMLTLVLKPYLQSVQHGLIDSVLLTCLGPGGPSSSRGWSDGAKADNQQWTRFAESWWRAFHRRKPVPPSKAAGSRRSPVRGHEKEERQAVDVSTDDIDWSEEPTIPAVPPIQLAAAQHIGSMIAGTTSSSSVKGTAWHSSSKPPVHPVATRQDANVDEEPLMNKSISSSVTGAFSRAESPAASLRRSFSAVSGMKMSSAKTGAAQLSTSQPLTALQAFSMASTPVALTPQQAYRTHGPSTVVPGTPPVMWTSPPIGARTPMAAPGTPQQMVRTPMLPMRGTVGAPMPLTPQSQLREELMLTPQSLSRYRQTLPTRTLNSVESHARVQTVQHTSPTVLSHQSPPRPSSSSLSKSHSVSTLPGRKVSTVSSVTPVYATRAPSTAQSPQVYYEYEAPPRVSSQTVTHQYVQDPRAMPATAYVQGFNYSAHPAGVSYVGQQSRPIVHAYASSGYPAAGPTYTTVSRGPVAAGQLPSRMSVLTKQQPPTRQLMQPLII
ncbi:hypothetical protein FOL46_002163 [Perkinsus olseni]|uniref:Kinesin motor domain-containing protein n=1 Tax=Perkinsus olseni TaxID=32597 RepID=A0A7J6M952_PEROL|nr:hypothetical protein FOL46_002163 [Perkinsus olseni]